MTLTQANSADNNPVTIEIVAAMKLLKEEIEQDVSEADSPVVAWLAGLTPEK